MLSIVKCPVCHARLVRQAAAFVCEHGHSFDVARQGYVNLLLPDKRRSDEPGDSPDMMRSRRAFLQAGFYEPIAAAVAGVVADEVKDRHSSHIADLGCGEGYFLAHVKRALDPGPPEPHAYYGVDISRTGVRMATAYDRSIAWIVASLHTSPFVAGSLDLIVSMFAPVAAEDFRRVLRDDGVLVIVTPGPDHLDALRAIIYPSVDAHDAAPLSGDPHFHLTASKNVRYTIALETPAQIAHLLAMTPYYWNISLETKARVNALARLDVTVDADIRVFRRDRTSGVVT